MTRSRLAAAGVALALLVGVPLPAGASGHHGTFVDDDGHPAEQSLEWLEANGVLHGCDPPENRRVCPARVLTRMEAAKMLVLAGAATGHLPEPGDPDTDRFVDDDGIWRGAGEAYTELLADRGVIHGCDPPTNMRFCPHEHLTRGQIAKMAAAVFDPPVPPTYRSPWTDTAGSYFHPSARVGAYHGWWDASAGRFDGYRPVTRGEFAQVLARAAGADPCPDTPFTAARRNQLEQRYPGAGITAYAHDLATGCSYTLNPQRRQPTASVFKVMVMAGTLWEAQAAGREVTAWERSQLEPMIAESSNPEVRALWRHFGAEPWFAVQAERFGLDDTRVVEDPALPWGRTSTSAQDQADLLRQVLVGEWGPLSADSREMAWQLMTSVVPSQTWGVTAGVPEGWVVAQKNGFAGVTANSVGVVADPDGEPRYVVAVLTTGWPYWTEGVQAVEEVSGWVSAALAD